MQTDKHLIAFFSMEIALDSAMPTYSGGLGVLAGDTLRAAADRALSMVGMTLLHRKSYFRQKLDASGWQTEETDEWKVEKFLKELPARVSLVIEGRTVRLRAWQFDVRGVSGGIVPVYLLDTDLAENAEWDRHLTDQLYGGDQWYRLCQQIVLGVGGVILKSGCRVEELQLRTGEPIKLAILLYMIVAWRVLYVMHLGRECPELPCSVVFEEAEWHSSWVIIKGGNPPTEPPSLNQMVRMVASFGGFLGRKSDGYPGPKTLWTGLSRVQDFAFCWLQTAHLRSSG